MRSSKEGSEAEACAQRGGQQVRADDAGVEEGCRSDVPGLVGHHKELSVSSEGGKKPLVEFIQWHKPTEPLLGTL